MSRKIRFQNDLKDMLVPIDKLVPHPDNANEGDVDEIMNSMRANTVYRPIYAHRQSGRILGGHHVYAALMELGSDVAPVIWLDMDEATARRVLAGDNQIARLARTNPGQLLELLQAIESESGFFGTGFPDTAIEDLLAEIEATADRPLHVEFDANPPGTGEGQQEMRVQCPSCGYEWRLGHAE